MANREQRGATPVAATFSKDRAAWGNICIASLETGGGDQVLGRRLDPSRPYGSHDTWIDWVSGLGALILCEDNADFYPRVSQQARYSAAFSLPHRLEEETAQHLVALVKKHLPHWRNEHLQVRWLSTGSGCTEAAVRLARAVTGHKMIIRMTGSYHGWHDWAMQGVEPGHGVVQNGSVAFRDWNDFSWLDDDAPCDTYVNDLAAVIVEQPLSEPETDWYPRLKQFCQRHGALLIMDEIVCAFRYAVMGASELWRPVEPDFICLGKALGNGYPIAALVGPSEYTSWFGRRDPVFVSSTNFGNPVCLQAARQVIEAFDRHSRSIIDHIWTIGRELMLGLETAGWQVQGQPPRSLMKFSSEVERAIFIREMARRGILINRPNFPNSGHNIQSVRKTTAAAAEVRSLMEKGLLRQPTQDEMPRLLFSQR